MSVKYIYDLPYKQRQQLCRILDADRRWEELGGNHMKFDGTTLILIGDAIYCEKSPTSKLFDKYSQKNGTIANLFSYLYKMNHKRAMSILEPYVDPKLKILMRSNTSSTYISFPSHSMKDDVRRSSVLQASTTYKHVSGAYGTSYKDKKNLTSKKSKLVSNANSNHNFSSNSLSPRRLNMAHIKAKDIATKSSHLNQLKKNTNHQQELMSDNVPEKMDIQEIFLNGKQLKLSHFPSGANYNLQDTILPEFTHIPFSEIVEVTYNFKETCVLGKGGFGTVYKGKWKGISVAIKRLSPKIFNPRQQFVSIKQSLNEFNILKCCRFDHILPLYAVSLDGADPCLIYELMVNGSLEDRLLCRNNTSPLTWLQRNDIAEGTAKGLNYLHTAHKKPLIHGDIKSANILLDAIMKAKIGDFGLTREGPDCDRTHVTVTSVNGTRWYLPDEYLRGKKLSPEVDVYSYGIVMLEVATGLRPYDLRTKKKLVEYVKECDDSGQLYSLLDVKAGTENMLLFRKFIEVGQVCSNIEKKKRPSMQQVLGVFEKVKSEIILMNNNQPRSPIPLVIPGIKNVSLPVEEGGGTESPEENYSSISSTDSSSESESPALPQTFIKTNPFPPVEIVEVTTSGPPIPLITELGLPVPLFDQNSYSEKLQNSKDIKS